MWGQDRTIPKPPSLRLIAVSGETSPRQSGSLRPDAPRILVPEIDTCTRLLRPKTYPRPKPRSHSVRVGTHLWFYFICHDDSPTKKFWLAKTKAEKETLSKSGSNMRSTQRFEDAFPISHLEGLAKKFFHRH
jgi:hypothetical protein